MARLIKNKNDLNKILEDIATKMLADVREKVYTAIHESIETYYAEYTPSEYKRTHKFLNSLVKTNITRKGNELYCEVKIDEEYLRYSYPKNERFRAYLYPQGEGRNATGYDVVSWANWKFPNDTAPGGNHGYIVNEGRREGFWDIAINDLGNIVNLMKKNLRKQGLKIT